MPDELETPENNPASQENLPPAIDVAALQRRAEAAELYAARVREQDTELARLRAEANKAPATPTPSNEDRNSTYWDKPADAMRGVITEEVNRAIEPLKQFITQQNTKSQYDTLKDAMRNNSNFPHFKSVEQILDQLMSGQPANVNSITFMYNTAVGIAMQQGTLTAPANSINPTNNNPVNPPNIPTSAPAMPRNTPVQSNGTLTETEKRIARLNGLTDEQYIAERDKEIASFDPTMGRKK